MGKGEGRLEARGMVPLSYIENMFPCREGTGEDEVRQCELVRRRYVEFAAFLAMEIPLGSELTSAFQRLQESYHWAITGISVCRKE